VHTRVPNPKIAGTIGTIPNWVLCLVFLAFLLVVSSNPAFSQQTAPHARPCGDSPALDVDSDAKSEGTQSMLPHFTSSRIWLTGQANFILQAHPEFPALYSGPHSLDAHYEKATSRVLPSWSISRKPEDLH
jgi:hypothetical protein